MTSTSTDFCTWLLQGQRLATGDHATLLDAALAAGLSVPFSCRRGACGSCAAEVVDGRHTPADGASPDAIDPGPGCVLMCQTRAQGELVLRIPNWVPQPAPVRLAMRVLQKTALSADVTGLTLLPSEPLATQPGQHLRVSLNGGDYRCFSIANRRSDDTAPIELQVRRVDGGRSSDQQLATLNPGDVLDVEGPFGMSASLTTAPLVLLATGTGYAGVRALLQAALADPQVPSIHLYWGGRHAHDHYARDELDDWCARDARLRWAAVHPQPTKGHAGHDAALQRHVQDHALAAGHDWARTRVHACGNPAMLRDARLQLLAAGLPAAHWQADAFVSTGRTAEPHDWERTGPRFDRAGIVAARERSIAAVHNIAARLQPGITAAEARTLADECLRALGADRTWHPTIVRFGADTVCNSRDHGDPSRRLQADDVFFIDIGPVWDGYEGDYGDTFVMGENATHHRCASAARAVFDEARDAWLAGATGQALYDVADTAAARHGCTLVREMPGHRIADFPHALYGKFQLAQAGFAPSEGLWVLEVQLRDRERPVGAFFEDVLLRG